MTLYITPFNRISRRRWADRFFEDWPRFEMENEVAFPVDVKVEPEDFKITALLPGLTAEDINIQVVNETVTIQGEFKDENDENASYLVQERPSGKFTRVISLPEPVDSGKAEAGMVNGVLTLHLPKAEEARPKTIKIVAK